jgi:hypothetical protein
VNSNELVVQVIAALEQCSIPYMLVGSYSSNAYGVARSTQDADFVIELADRSPTELFERLKPEISFDPQMRLESVTMTSRWVGRSSTLPFKIELFLISDDAHDRERFRRRREQPFLTQTAFLPTPEDVVIQKLRWFLRGRRAKDLDDCRNVIAVQAQTLDFPYLRRWCDTHGTRELLEQLLIDVERVNQQPPQ